MVCGILPFLALQAAPPSASKTPAGHSVQAERIENFSLNGLTIGSERADCTRKLDRESCTVKTDVAWGSGVRLTSELVSDRGKLVSLRVQGDAPSFLLSTLDDAADDGAADRSCLKSPLPLEGVAALIRRSVATRRESFVTKNDGTLRVVPCLPTRPSSGSTCHEVEGLTWGALQMWLDPNGGIVAAIVPTAWGLLVATRPERDDDRSFFLTAFAESRAKRLSERVMPLASDGPRTVIRNVRLVDPAHGVTADAAIVIEGERIVAAGAAAQLTLPSDARVIDGRGGSLVPGLWDMHAHMKQPEWGPAYLAAGVTTVRDLGNEPSYIEALRASAKPAFVPYPNMLLAAFIDAHASVPYTAIQANTAAQARTLVRRFKRDGYDQIKVWENVAATVLPQITDEAHALGMRVTGHVPAKMTAFEAIDAGLDGVNHIFRLIDASDNDIQSPNGRRLVALLLKRNISVDPTLVVVEFGTRSTASPIANFEPGILKAPRPVFLAWNSFGRPPDQASREPLQRAMTFVRGLHRAGVPIVAGSDQGVPGHTLHREIELYVEAGLSPLEALATATTVPARVMGLDGRVGSIGPRMQADLVLVDGDPDRSIQALRHVRLVIRRGMVFEPDPLWRAVDFTP